MLPKSASFVNKIIAWYYLLPPFFLSFFSPSVFHFLSSSLCLFLHASLFSNYLILQVRQSTAQLHFCKYQGNFISHSYRFLSTTTLELRSGSCFEVCNAQRKREERERESFDSLFWIFMISFVDIC